MAPGERELRKIWWAAIHRATLDYFSCNELVGREAIRAQESAARWFFRSDQGDLNSFENILALLGDNPETWRKKLMRPETEQIVKQKYLNRWYSHVISRQGPGHNPKTVTSGGPSMQKRQGSHG